MYLEIITPEKIVYQQEVDEVTIPTVTGEITVLPNHITLLSQVSEGELVIKSKGRKQSIAITSGFLEVSKNKIIILANFAIHAEDIQIAKVKEAQERAEKLMKEKSEGEDFATASAELTKAILQLKVAHKHRGTRTPIAENSV